MKTLPGSPMNQFALKCLADLTEDGRERPPVVVNIFAPSEEQARQEMVETYPDAVILDVERVRH